MGSDDRVRLEYLPVIITGITLHRQTASSESESTGCSAVSVLTNGLNILHGPGPVEISIDLISASSFH